MTYLLVAISSKQTDLPTGETGQGRKHKRLSSDPDSSFLYLLYFLEIEMFYPYLAGALTGTRCCKNKGLP